jgi:enoyl-[acyl-carrier protein] reductase II
MSSALRLGDSGVQVGSRFVATPEASSHLAFKEAVIHVEARDTRLSLKRLTPFRLLKNAFFEVVQEAEIRGASKEELLQLLDRARAKKPCLKEIWNGRTRNRSGERAD